MGKNETRVTPSVGRNAKQYRCKIRKEIKWGRGCGGGGGSGRGRGYYTMLE